MDILNSLVIGVFGMAVVFLVLVLLIVLINIQTFVARKLIPRGNGGSKGASAPIEAPTPAAPPPDPQGLTLVGVDERTAAIVMAVICDQTGIPPEELYFRTIRAMDDSPSEQSGRSTPA
jgi:Na+-transporting methylmalonyl-CoA/oxaloacetate decarboxylase gamma subunit